MYLRMIKPAEQGQPETISDKYNKYSYPSESLSQFIRRICNEDSTKINIIRNEISRGFLKKGERTKRLRAEEYVSIVKEHIKNNTEFPDDCIYCIYGLEGLNTLKSKNLETMEVNKIPSRVMTRHLLNFIQNKKIEDTSLPKNYFAVSNDFNASGAFNLHFLPKLMTVDGDFNASYSGLETLPEEFYCNGDIYLNNCKNFKRIPQWMNVLGYKEYAGKTLEAKENLRTVVLDGCGFSVDTWEELKNNTKHLKGVSFKVSEPPILKIQIKNLQEAEKYFLFNSNSNWQQTRDIIQNLSPRIQQDFFYFLTLIINEPVCSQHIYLLNLSKRIISVIELLGLQEKIISDYETSSALSKLKATNEEIVMLRAKAETLLSDAISSCNMRALAYLDQFDILIGLENAKKNLYNEEALKNVCYGMMYEEALDEYVSYRSNMCKCSDDVLVKLYFKSLLLETECATIDLQSNLKDKIYFLSGTILDFFAYKDTIGFSSLYCNCKQEKYCESFEIKRILKKIVSEKEKKGYILSWEPYTRYKALEALKKQIVSFKDLQVKIVDKIEKCSILSSDENDIVGIVCGEDIIQVSYNALIESYLMENKGENPFTKEKLNFDFVYRLETVRTLHDNLVD